jgi:serine/threonine protein kinase
MLKPLAKMGFKGSYMKRYSPASTQKSESDSDDSPLCFTHRAVWNPRQLDPLVGNLTDHYKVLCVIHDGGEQCRVKRVQSKADGTEYVMKIQQKKCIRSRDEELFRKMSVRMMNMPLNEHVVRIHACLEDSHYFYTLQEACHGGNLCDFLRLVMAEDLDTATLENEVRQVMSEVLISLDHLHKEGLVHKDVKLENFVFKKKGSDRKRPSVLKLIDFDFTEQQKKKKTISVLGTDGYIAPEAYLGDVCAKSDIFSAGVMMFALISGRFPYDDTIFDDHPDQNYAGNAKMNEIHYKLRNTKVSFGRSWKHLQEAKDFCKALMEFDVDKRLNAEEALKHPWMAKLAGGVKLEEIKETKKKESWNRTTVRNFYPGPSSLV